MKKILILAFLFVFISDLKSQNIPTIPSIQTMINDSLQPNRQLKVSVFNRLLSGIVKFLPDVISDTSSVSTKHHGMFRFQRADSAVYVYDTIGFKRWRKAGSGSTLSNIGSGHRLAVQGTDNVKTLFGGYGILWDSTSNANALTAKLDSATVFQDIRSTIATGSSSTPDTIHKQLTSLISPTSLTWALKKKTRWIGFIDSKDELLNISGDMFNRTDLFTTTGPSVTQTTSAGEMTLSIAGGGFALSTMKFPVTPKGSFWCMEVKISAYTGTQYFGIGLVKDSANFVGGELQLASSSSQGMNVINNSFNFTAGGTIPSWTGELTIYVVMSGDYMRMAWADENGQVTWGVTCDLEFSRGASTKTVLSGDYGFGFYLATGSGAASVTIKSIKAGYFKGVGLSDISFVSKEDGTPLVTNNTALFTASIKGFTIGDGAGICSGVFKLNLQSLAFERTSLIFHETSTNIVNDAATNLIFDTETKRFKYFVPRWGEDRGFTMSGASSRMLYKEVDENLLNGVHIIDSMTILNIGGRDVTYDPAVVKHNNEWYMGFSYYPSGSISGSYRFSLVKTTDFNTFTTIVDTSLYDLYEGQKVVKIADTLFIATANTSVFRFFNLNGNSRGTISTPISGLTQPQHPAIIPIQSNGKTRFLLLTFDTGNSSFHPSYGLNNYTNGNTYIYISNQSEQGYEYPIYRTPIISIDE